MPVVLSKRSPVTLPKPEDLYAERMGDGILSINGIAIKIGDVIRLNDGRMIENMDGESLVVIGELYGEGQEQLCDIDEDGNPIPKAPSYDTISSHEVSQQGFTNISECDRQMSEIKKAKSYKHYRRLRDYIAELRDKGYELEEMLLNEATHNLMRNGASLYHDLSSVPEYLGYIAAVPIRVVSDEGDIQATIRSKDGFRHTIHFEEYKKKDLLSRIRLAIRRKIKP